MSSNRILWPKWGTLRSRNGKYDAVMQHDGNFVIYKKNNSKDYSNPIWSIETQLRPEKRPFYLKLQSDGNLVMYSTDKRAVWSSGSASQGQGPYFLIMQNDGNLVIYDRNSKAIWHSNSQQI